MHQSHAHHVPSGRHRLCSRARPSLRARGRVRYRRRVSRQVHGPRQVRERRREGLRLLRRRRRLGLQRPALRQREGHGLAHRLSRRLRAPAAPDDAADPVRERPAALHRRVRRQVRRGLPARHAAPRADGAEVMGFSVSAAAEFEFFLFEETPHSVREKRYSNMQEHHAGLLRLLDAARRRARRFLPRAARPRPQHEFRDRGPPYRDRPRRARSRDPRRRGPGARPTRRPCSRRSPRSSRSGAAGWRPSWRNGRATGRASPAISTRRCRTRRPARARSTTRSAA